MNKRDKEPKTSWEHKQGDLFASCGVVNRAPVGGTSRRAKRAELLFRLEEQRTLTMGIMEAMGIEWFATQGLKSLVMIQRG